MEEIDRYQNLKIVADFRKTLLRMVQCEVDLSSCKDARIVVEFRWRHANDLLSNRNYFLKYDALFFSPNFSMAYLSMVLGIPR